MAKIISAFFFVVLVLIVTTTTTIGKSPPKDDLGPVQPPDDKIKNLMYELSLGNQLVNKICQLLGMRPNSSECRHYDAGTPAAGAKVLSYREKKDGDRTIYVAKVDKDHQQFHVKLFELPSTNGKSNVKLSDVQGPKNPDAPILNF